MNNFQHLDLKKQYANLIHQTKYRFPNYDEINFKTFLSTLFPNTTLFINNHNLINRCRNLREEHFKQFGSLMRLTLSDLHYYQEFVGISGPKHSDENDPVSFLQYDDGILLFNGYHRTLLKLAKGERQIDGYLVNLNNPNIISIISNN